MSLKDRIEADYREAFKAKNADVMAALRMLKAAVKNAEIEKRKDFEDDEVEGVVVKESKKINDSIEAFKKGGRQDLVSTEEAQLGALKQYMPKQLSADELEDIVQDVINRLGADNAKDMGKVMKEVTKVTSGQTDGKTVSELVKKNLSKNQS